jgi:hypothetical protein
MGARSDTVEQVAARIADRAHGVVTRAELLRAGVTRREIARRLRSGTLLRVYPGVYRVGHRAPSVEARYMAAVKACGRGARLCGRAAAHLLGILKGPPPPEVAAPGRRRAGAPAHRRARQYRYHGSRHAWEQDRRREREAYARGDGFRRYTYGDVFDDPGAMLAELRGLLVNGPRRPAARSGTT